MRSASAPAPGAARTAAWFRLVRWQNAALAAAGVALGAWWGAGRWSPRVLAGMLAAVALTAAANAWNDAADVEIDRLAHPRRPLPSGVISGAAARRLGAAAAAIGVALAALARPVLGALSVAAVALMYAYSPWLKRRGVLGNVTAALLASLPFLYGAWCVGRPAAGVELVGLAAPLHLAREIAKDLDDAAADAASRRTLPVTAGVGAARIALLLSIVVFFVALAPLVWRRPALAPALLPAGALIAWGTSVSLRGRRGSPALLKAAMVCAMAALLVGAFQ